MRKQKVEKKKMDMKIIITKMKMQKTKKLVPIPKKMRMKICCQNIWKILMKKLFKKYSNSKNFNSFINEFDHATNNIDKEKIVKELKDIHYILNDYAEMEDDYREYKCKLFDIINAIDYFLH